MRHFAIPCILAGALLAAASAPAATGQWIHVAVDERKDEGATVRVNVPIEMLTAVLPLVKHERLADGKVKLEMGDSDMSAADLRKMWEAVRSSRDGEYVTVDGPKEKVRVAKRGEFLLVEVNDGKDRPAKVHVKVPVAMVDALLSGTDDGKIDLEAGLEALARSGSGDMVVVDAPDAHVRIWIDANDTAK